MRVLLTLIFWLLAPVIAFAGDLVVTVRTPAGAPVVDAVVSIAAAHGPLHLPWPYRMAQKNMAFDPFVLVVPVGADVAFPNLDTIRHHVYSFSPTKTFELKLYGHDETRVVHFDRVGVVELGCNIHDSMIAFIDVVDTPFVAKTDASGVAVIHGAPTGVQSVNVWRPYLHAPRNTLSQTAQIPQDGTQRLTFTADVRAPPERRHTY